MQKRVSKKNLMITALGILLVLSLAFTTTLAAFTANATVSGTIRFQGSLEITATGTAVSEHTSGEAITGTVSPSVWAIDMIVSVGNPTTIALDTTDALNDNALSNLTSVTIDGKGLAFAYTVTLQFDSGDVHVVSGSPNTYAFAVGSTVGTVSGATGARDSADTTNRTAKWTGTVNAGATSTITFAVADLLTAANVTIDNSKLSFTNGDVDEATATLTISATTSVPTP